MTIAEEFATRNFSKIGLGEEGEIQLANGVLQVFTDNGKHPAHSMLRAWTCDSEGNGPSLSRSVIQDYYRDIMGRPTASAVVR